MSSRPVNPDAPRADAMTKSQNLHRNDPHVIDKYQQAWPDDGNSAQSDPRPPYSAQTEDMPWKGTGRLRRRVALITGGDSGIGRAVAIAYAREGADVAISYLNDTGDATDTERLILDTGRQCLLLPGDISDPAHCRAIVAAVVEEFGRIDILVNNATHQHRFDDLDGIADKEWQRTFAFRIHGTFSLCKAAVPHMKEGASIINTAAITAGESGGALLAAATAQGAIQGFTSSLAHILSEKAIRVNCVAPGPVWPPLVPGSAAGEPASARGDGHPMRRPAPPVELASAYVMLADPMSRSVSGATIAVTCGNAMT